MSNIHENRPLSPFMLGKYYRFQISSFLSILHRITGFGLTIGILPLALWLWGAAYEPALFDCITQAASSIVGKLFLFGWTWAFFYHLANGLRHLSWDFGYGFKLDDMTASGWLVVVFSIAMSIFTWAIIFKKVGL